jgi:DNA-binding transcriptional LysR family regulator
MDAKLVPAGMRDQWLGVELRHLAALLAVEEEGSFRRAGVRLGYVQSAISQQIASLERAIGTRLVDRARGPGLVSLTPAGEVLARRAERIHAHLRLAHDELELFTDPGLSSTAA